MQVTVSAFIAWDLEKQNKSGETYFNFLLPSTKNYWIILRILQRVYDADRKNIFFLIPNSAYISAFFADSTQSPTCVSYLRLCPKFLAPAALGGGEVRSLPWGRKKCTIFSFNFANRF